MIDGTQDSRNLSAAPNRSAFEALTGARFKHCAAIIAFSYLVLFLAANGMFYFGTWWPLLIVSVAIPVVVAWITPTNWSEMVLGFLLTCAFVAIWMTPYAMVSFGVRFLGWDFEERHRSRTFEDIVMFGMIMVIGSTFLLVYNTCLVGIVKGIQRRVAKRNTNTQPGNA